MFVAIWILRVTFELPGYLLGIRLNTVSEEYLHDVTLEGTTWGGLTSLFDHVGQFGGRPGINLMS